MNSLFNSKEFQHKSRAEQANSDTKILVKIPPKRRSGTSIQLLPVQTLLNLPFCNTPLPLFGLLFLKHQIFSSLGKNTLSFSAYSKYVLSVTCSKENSLGATFSNELHWQHRAIFPLFISDHFQSPTSTGWGVQQRSLLARRRSEPDLRSIDFGADSLERHRHRSFHCAAILKQRCPPTSAATPLSGKEFIWGFRGFLCRLKELHNVHREEVAVISIKRFTQGILAAV